MGNCLLVFFDPLESIADGEVNGRAVRFEFGGLEQFLSI
jgi:hypothetical protein